jgi:hypothetical protein
MVVGMLIGWGLGAAAMRAGLAARSQVLLQSQLLREAERYVNSGSRACLRHFSLVKGKMSSSS